MTKQIKKRPLLKPAFLELEVDKLQNARGGEGSLGKVVMDANILPT